MSKKRKREKDGGRSKRKTKRQRQSSKQTDEMRGIEKIINQNNFHSQIEVPI